MDRDEPVVDTGVGSADKIVVAFATFVFSCRAVCVSFLFLCLAFLFLKIGQGLLKKILHFPFQQLPGLPWEVVDYILGTALVTLPDSAKCWLAQGGLWLFNVLLFTFPGG